MSECLPCASFNTVGQGRSCFFSLKLLTNNYKLNVVGSFLVHPDLKDFKSLFIISEFFDSIISSLTFKLIARKVSAATLSKTVAGTRSHHPSVPLCAQS